jgi:hypothetical protein
MGLKEILEKLGKYNIIIFAAFLSVIESDIN